jgi:hypothetical protein
MELGRGVGGRENSDGDSPQGIQKVPGTQFVKKRLISHFLNVLT